MDLGFNGYVLDEGAFTHTMAAIKCVAIGRFCLGPALPGHVINLRRCGKNLDGLHPGLAELTPTERRVLGLIAPAT